MTTNTLTNLLPDAYAALDVISRELTGLIPSVTVDARANQAAKGQDIRVPVIPESNALIDITPSMSDPSEADQTFDNVAITLTKYKAAPFSWDGEEEYGMNQGVGINNLRSGQILQAMRKLVNDVEADLAALHTGFSRAAGAVGTAPFCNNYSSDYSHS